MTPIDAAMLQSCAIPLLGLALAPLLPGLINRTKAFFGGRQGPPLLQLYFDLGKLLRKGAVYSRTTTWVFRAGPAVSLAALLAALLLMPLGSCAAPVAFTGDLLVLLYLFAAARFATMLAALDTGSAFEGMGASREAQFSALAEPALLVALAALVRTQQSVSVSGIVAAVNPAAWAATGAVLTLATIALFIVLLAENARIPVDDPNTHLELTMIHEVMVLDHGGPDFAFIQYGAALKLWIMAALVAGLAVPVRTGHAALDLAATLGGIALVGVLVGIVESTMARLRLNRVPQLLVGAATLGAVALLLTL